MDPVAEAVRNLIRLQRQSNGLGGLARQNLDEILVEIAEQLGRLDPTSVQVRYRRGRLQKLLARAAAIVSDGFADVRSDMVGGVRGIGEEQAALALRGLPGEPKLTRLRSGIRELATVTPMDGVTLEGWLDRAEASLAHNLERQFTLGVTAGESVTALKRRMRGVRKTSLGHLAGIARTATTSIAAQSHLYAFRQNPDIVESVEFVATLDERTTIVCGRLDGTVWPLGDPGIQAPPLHFRCRSTLAAVVDYAKFGLDIPRAGERATKTGPVPSSTTYVDWFRAQSAAAQDRMIGPSRGRLFRAGEITFDQMVGRDNTIVPLDVLRN